MKIFNKIIVSLILLSTSITLLSCTDSESSKEELNEKVITLEQNQNKLENLGVTYDEYKENVADLATDEFLESKSNDELFVIEDKVYTNDDLNNLSEDEIEKLKKEIKEIKEKLGLKVTHKKLQVSKSYDTDTENTKYVFSKISERDESDTETIKTKRYTFTKDDEKWKIQNTEFDTVSIPDDIDKDELLPNLKYQTKDNQDIEYIEEFDLLDD